MEHFYSFINIPVDIDNHTEVGYSFFWETKPKRYLFK